MQLPPSLRRAIEQELASCDPGRLRAASARLSDYYRQPGTQGDGPSPQAGQAGTGQQMALRPLTQGIALANDDLRAAYLGVRMPATFAAAVAALDWTREAFARRIRGESCEEDCNASSGELHTVLDLGSGPGTALWAAARVFPTLQSATAFERDPRLIEIARRLASGDAEASDVAAYPPVLRHVTWLQGDLTAALPEGTWDLVVCSYTLNELNENQRAELIRRVWARAGKLLVVIEPGTKAGFANVLAVRTSLLAAGATLVAPCPNALACPMADRGDWCHFAARVERTAEHRRLKDASLGHEDEKFSYVAFTRSGLTRNAITHSAVHDELQSNNPPREPARIVRHPRIFSGYTQLTLCAHGEISNTTVTRSKKEDWRRLKRLGWGDLW